MKKVISLILCLILVLSLAITASAATVVNSVQDHTFAAFQVFSGSQGTDASLGKIQWGSGVNGSALLNALKINQETKGYFEHIEDDAPDAENKVAASLVADVLGHKDTPVTVINHFAQLAYTNRAGGGIKLVPGEQEIPAGYYVIVDLGVVGEDSDGDGEPDNYYLPEGDAYNAALLQITNAGPITIGKKYDKPEHEKYVIADDEGDNSGHGSMEDAPLGSAVQFHLKAEMPLDMSGFEKYTMTFHDDLSDGLEITRDEGADTYNTWISTVELWVNEVKVENTYYTVVVNPADCTKDGVVGEKEYACDFHVVIPDVMTIPSYEAGCDVVVRYTAVLGEAALINEGNANNFRLEYANNPNWDPERPGSEAEQPTGVTPWKEVNVYTTEVEILKVDGTTDQPLTGAKFTLEGNSANKVKVTKNEFVVYTPEDETAGEQKYWELTDGSFTTTAPAASGENESYVKEEDGTYIVYSNKTVTSFETVNEQKQVEAYVGNDGIVKFAGLGEGTYTVTESDVPDGYNGLKEPMILKIVYHEATNKWEYSWTGGATGSGASIQVDNMKGSVLPETGGIGTTLFYIIGGLLVAGSAVLLVTKKRMSAE